MKGRRTYFRNHKTAWGVVILAFVLVLLSYGLEVANAQACIFPDKTAWVTLDVLRPVFLLAARQALPAYLYEDSRFLQDLLQMGASTLSLFCVLGWLGMVCKPITNSS
jgi:hypothetical protein